MAAQKGDYIGFTYNGTHSSKLGIVRTSDGSRFNTNLLPTMQDKTVTVPGRDGSYYFGSTYTQRQFSISFAYDSLTEKQFAEIRRVFGDKGVHDLIFDETPYKVYSAKVTGTATLKHIPFSEGEDNRLYKGEGTIQFTCYYPFARCRYIAKGEYMDIPEYSGLTNEEKEERIEEWWEASRIGEGGNFGDIPVPFKIDILPGSGKIEIGTKTISWNNLPDAVILDTRTGLALLGNNVYNQYFTGDLTVKIPVDGNVVIPKNVKAENVGYTCEYY